MSKPKQRTEKREKDRLQRKAQLAERQAAQFEDELSSHELNLERLNALPAEVRSDDHQELVAQAQASITQLDVAIETTYKSAESLKQQPQQ